MKKEFYDALIQLTEEKNVLTDEPLKNHVTFRVGGAADYFVSPESAEEVQKIILLCKEASAKSYDCFSFFHLGGYVLVCTFCYSGSAYFCCVSDCLQNSVNVNLMRGVGYHNIYLLSVHC